MRVDLDAPEHSVCSAALRSRDERLRSVRYDLEMANARLTTVLSAIAQDWPCDANAEGFHVKHCRKCTASAALQQAGKEP